MESLIGLGILVAVLLISFLGYQFYVFMSEKIEAMAAEKLADKTVRKCLCPKCNMDVTSAVWKKMDDRPSSALDDLLMKCPYCSVEAVWDVMGDPPVPKRVIERVKPADQKDAKAA